MSQKEYKTCKTTKTFVGCNEIKHISSFYNSRVQCKDCTKKLDKQRRDKFKELTQENLNLIDLNEMKNRITELEAELEENKLKIQSLTDIIDNQKTENEALSDKIEAYKTIIDNQDH